MTATRNLASWVPICVVTMMVIGCAKPGGSAAAPRRAKATKIPVPVFSDVTATADAPALKSNVTKVTVYSDRARVTRQTTVDLTTEPNVLAFRNLPGWVDDGSVRVSVSAGRILDVRVERSFLANASDETWKKAEAEHKAITNRLAALNDELAVLAAQKNQIEAIKAFSLEKITQDTTIGNITVKSYGDVLTFISDALRKTAKARRAVQLERDEINPIYQASVRRLAELKSLMKLEETTVLVMVQGSSATRSTIELTYMIPGVTWEPMHELRVSTSDAKTVEVISFASVTQTSGEDWGNAELSFSTQSSVQSVRIPELEALTLGDTHTATRILTTRMSSFTRAQKAFEVQNRLWNKVHQRSRRERANFEQTYQKNIEFLQVVQTKTVRIFDTLQKRGTTAHFKANAAPNVRGDGHPVRMRIGSSTLESTQKIVAAPEQSLNAASTLAMINSTGQSLLPGKVALYQDGAFLGMTDIDFIAQGEKFSLFVGVADHLKLSRKLDRKHSTLIRKKRNRMTVSFIVTVENLSDKATALTLADRIPVSENKAIKIDRVKITDKVKPDSHGLLYWKLTLKPKEKRRFRISYRVEYPAELMLEVRRQRQNARPGSPVMRKKYRIEDQLMDLEEQF